MSKFSNFSQYSIGHFMQGPRNAQTASKTSYVEFLSEGNRQKFLNDAQSISFTSTSGSIRVRGAKTKFNKHRDWALGRARELLRTAAPGKAVEADFKNRFVQVDGSKGFQQSNTDFEGMFLRPFLISFPEIGVLGGCFLVSR